MTKNMGPADRTIRMILALLFVVLYFMGFVSGVLGIILLVLAGVFLVTSFIGFCPLYTLVGVDTCSVRKPE